MNACYHKTVYRKKWNWKNPDKIKMLLKFQCVPTALNGWDVTVNSRLSQLGISTAWIYVNRINSDWLICILRRFFFQNVIICYREDVSKLQSDNIRIIGIKVISENQLILVPHLLSLPWISVNSAASFKIVHETDTQNYSESSQVLSKYILQLFFNLCKIVLYHAT